MKFRYLLLAALIGGAVTFAWGIVSHITGIMPALEPNAFTAPDSVVAAVRASAPSNGVYYDDRGLLAVVSFERDLSPKFASMAVPMMVQLAIDCATAFLLAWVLLRLPPWSPFGTGSIFAAFGLAAGMAQLFSEANWYGYPLPFQLANLAGLVIGWFLLGIVVGALRRRLVLAVE